MTRAQIATRTAAIIRDHFAKTGHRPQPGEITDATSLAEDLGADSLDTVEILFALESEFDTEIPDDDAETILTVGQAVDWLVGRVAAVAA
jgi:acyl carrier protein